MNIDELIDEIRTNGECRISAPDGQVSPGENFAVPADLKRFYELCGGAELFPAEEFGVRICSAMECVPSNPKLLGKFYEQNRKEIDSDISANWRIIAEVIKLPQEIVTIDFSPERPGFCYDSFWDVYATGNSKIVARSFTEFLNLVYESKGLCLHWEKEGFDLGHAYDS